MPQLHCPEHSQIHARHLSKMQIMNFHITFRHKHIYMHTYVHVGIYIHTCRVYYAMLIAPLSGLHLNGLTFIIWSYMYMYYKIVYHNTSHRILPIALFTSTFISSHVVIKMLQKHNLTKYCFTSFSLLGRTDIFITFYQ